MVLVMSALLITTAAVLAVPVLVLLLQALAARFGRKRQGPADESVRPKAAVLIPAHNEADAIARTLANVKEELAPGDRVVVVADNCSDDTALTCGDGRSRGRAPRGSQLRGKGYALDTGVRYLERTGPADVVVVLDADCRFQVRSLRSLVEACARRDAPTQSLYEIVGVSESSLGTIARFAWVIKGRLRPIGYMHLVCHAS